MLNNKIGSHAPQLTHPWSLALEQLFSTTSVAKQDLAASKPVQMPISNLRRTASKCLYFQMQLGFHHWRNMGGRIKFIVQDVQQPQYTYQHVESVPGHL